MVLVIGGAYHGKLTWALDYFNLKESDCFDLASGDPDKEYAIYTHFEQYTKRHESEDINDILPLFKNSVLISREICCGVVPVDTKDRLYREHHGRVLKKVSLASNKVYRVYLGISEELK